MAEVRVEYQGPYEDSFALVGALRDAGHAVSWEPPDRERGDVVQDLVVGMVASGAVAGLVETVKYFVGKRSQTTVTISPDDDGPAMEFGSLDPDD
ncbi:MAG: hypothetical protein ACOYEV_15125 [Candidatus Nanopelagicales bacterium]